MGEIVKGTSMVVGKAVPFRVPLWTDGLVPIKAKCEETLDVCGEWEEVTYSTGKIALV